MCMWRGRRNAAPKAVQTPSLESRNPNRGARSNHNAHSALIGATKGAGSSIRQRKAGPLSHMHWGSASRYIIQVITHTRSER
jgi:hypothetical protein